MPNGILHRYKFVFQVLFRKLLKLSQSDVLFYCFTCSSLYLVVAPCGSNKHAYGVQVELLMTLRCQGMAFP